MIRVRTLFFISLITFLFVDFRGGYAQGMFVTKKKDIQLDHSKSEKQDYSVLQRKKEIIEPDDGSPRVMFSEFLSLLRKKDYEGIDNYFDFRQLSEKQKKEFGLVLSKKFTLIINRKFRFDLDTVSPLRLGNRKDDLPFYREKIISLDSKVKPFNIYLDRIKTKTGSRWLISPLTYNDIDRYYQEMTHGFMGKYIPESFFTMYLGEVPLYQVMLVILVCILSYLITYIVRFFWILFGKLVTYKSLYSKRRSIIFKRQFLGPINFLIFTSVWYLLINFLELPKTLNFYFFNIFKTLTLLGVTWVISKFIDWMADSWEGQLSKDKNSKLQASLIGGRQGLKALLFIVFLLLLFQNWGVNVTAIFASLGVGGIAIALAGQKTFENLFGGIMLATDKPVKVGDFCKFDNYMGTVEEIGPRSTKIRTLDRTVVVIPNGDFSQMKIENLQRRDRIRLHKIIGVCYETSPDQMRYLLIEIKKILLAHPKVDNDPCRIRFVDFNNYSLDIEIYAFILTREWAEFLAIKEDILLRVMELVNSSGTGFAFPSQTVYYSKDKAKDPEKIEDVHAKVKSWKEQMCLELPEFAEDSISKIVNTTDWPPKESILSKDK